VPRTRVPANVGRYEKSNEFVNYLKIGKIIFEYFIKN
jgi:hypothetical protein